MLCSKKETTSNHNYNWINRECELGNDILISEIETAESATNDYWKLLEQYWICQFRIWGFNLTNIREGGEDNYTPHPKEEAIEKRKQKIIGKPRSEKTKKDISAGLTGIKRSEETKEKVKNSVVKKQGRAVLQYDKAGNFIKEWITGSEAARALNIDKANLNACCKGKKGSCGGYIWKYKDPDKIPETKVARITENGEIVTIYNNSEEAARDLKINSVLINNVCKGKQKQTYYMYFKYC